MAQTVYDFARFEPQPKVLPQPKPVVKVSKGRGKAAKEQTRRMLRIMLFCSVLVALVCGVLYTQTTVTELQSQIASAQNNLVEQQILGSYLNSELEKMVNLRNIDERAQQLGLVMVDSSRVNNIRVSEQASLTVKKTALEEILEEIQARFLSVLDSFE